MNQQKPKFSLNASTLFKILKTIPSDTRVFQTTNDGGYDGDFVGTVKEFLSLLNLTEKSSGDLLWNVHDRTVLLIELTFIFAGEILPYDSDVFDDEHCVLLMYGETDQNLDLPRIGTKEKRPDPRYMKSINLSRPAKA